MADLADVETALIALIADVIYPAGPPGPSMISPVVNAIVDIRRGWPVPAQLDLALKSGAVLVRVYSQEGVARNTTRYLPQWHPLQPVPLTLSWTITGATVTFSGVGQVGAVIGVASNVGPQRIAFTRLIGAGDTPSSIATTFAGLFSGAVAVGPTLTMPTDVGLTVRGMVPTPEWLETRRQDQGFCVSAWVNSPDMRDRVISTIDNAIAGIRDAYGQLKPFISLADGSSGHIRFRTTYPNDHAERVGLYRRDVCYMVEYPTSLIEPHPLVLFPETAIYPAAVAERIETPVTVIY